MVLRVKKTRERGTYTVKEGFCSGYVIEGFYNNGEPFSVKVMTKKAVLNWLHFELGNLK